MTGGGLTATDCMPYRRRTTTPAPYFHTLQTVHCILPVQRLLQACKRCLQLVFVFASHLPLLLPGRAAGDNLERFYARMTTYHLPYLLPLSPTTFHTTATTLPPA